MSDYNLRPAIVLREFDKTWNKIFSSPIHLDTALSQVLPNYRGIIFQLVTALLQRPQSLARYLRLKMSPEEPWDLIGSSELADWQTAHVAAQRLLQSLRKDPHLLETDIVGASDFPPHIIEACYEWVGKKNGALILRALVQTSPVVLRVRRDLQAKEVLEVLKDKKVIRKEVKLSSVSPQAIVISDFTKVRFSEEFKKGFYEIQDDGSQFLAYYALWPEHFAPQLSNKPGATRGRAPALPEAPKKNYIVIDACAGAGGKTLALADALAGRGRVYAYDTSKRKLDSLRQRAIRADLHNIQTLALDEANAESSLKKFMGTADLVLVDAPCSGWGVLRRNPDIKWRQKTDELVRLPRLQASLLKLYSGLVKPGGRLVYGVCTFRKEETVDIVQAFTKSSTNFHLDSSGFLGPIGCDGFYMASFTKKGK